MYGIYDKIVTKFNRRVTGENEKCSIPSIIENGMTYELQNQNSLLIRNIKRCYYNKKTVVPLISRL